MTVLKTTMIGAAVFVLMGAKGEACIPADFSLQLIDNGPEDAMVDEPGTVECPPGSYADWICEAPIEPGTFEELEGAEGPEPGDPGQEAPDPGDWGEEGPEPSELGADAGYYGPRDGCELVCVLEEAHEPLCPQGMIEVAVCEHGLDLPEEASPEPAEPDEAAPLTPVGDCWTECVPTEECPHEEGASPEPLRA